jgi:hypothetical protein
MPNYCSNEVTIVFNEQDDYDKFITQMSIEDSTDPYLSYNAEDNGYGFFDRLVPTPADKLEDGWYDWRVKHWGTKWNPNIQTFMTDDVGKCIELAMDTAWAPPVSFFTTFTELFPSASVELNYLEEGMGFCGRAYMSQGMCSDDYMNEIPIAMYVAAGATTNAQGEIDWDEDQSYNLWEVINNEDEFNKLLEEA